jgi:hypothetical protein
MKRKPMSETATTTMVVFDFDGIVAAWGSGTHREPSQ